MPNTMTTDAVDATFAAVERTNNVPSIHQIPAMDREITAVLPPPVSGFKNIAGAMSSIMSEIGVIGEGGENKFQNYKYMSYKDLYRKLTPLMGKHGLAIIPTELRIDVSEDRAIVRATYQFTILHSSGEVWPAHPIWTGISRAKDSKGGWDDKALNKCATAAQKYFLKALFQIPSGEEDEDADHHDGVVETMGRAQSRVPSPSKAAEPTAPTSKLTSDKPHAISTEGMKLKAWSELFLLGISRTSSIAELEEWQNANTTPLDVVRERIPDTFNVIAEAVEALEAGFKPKVKQDPISSGPAKKPTKKTPSGISPVTDLDGFMMHHLGTMLEMTDGGELETYFNDKIKPWEDDLFPTDAADLLLAFEKAQAKLAIEE